MRVILTNTIRKLGRAGEVKEVADGYARNFLIPKGLAALATPKKIQGLLTEDAHRAAQEARERERAKRLAQTLAGTTLSLTLSANEEGTLYAAVRAREVADALAERGLAVEAEQVELSKEPIKRTGKYFVRILFRNAEAMLTVRVDAAKYPEV